MRHHKYADIFPMMTDEELAALVQDMRQNGYDESSPIVTIGGEILDGRNRYKAAQIAGVVPVFVEFHGDDPLAYVIRHNLNRRHLNESQRAVIAARLANMTYSDGAILMHLKHGHASANLHWHKNKSGENSPSFSLEQAAEMLNVGRRTVATVKAVERAAPELVKAIERGEMTAHEAQKKIRERERMQERQALAEKASIVPASNKWTVIHADMKTVKLDKQFDFIITDPPYPKEYLHLWRELGRRAAEWLKDGGLLIAMSGQSYVNEIYKMLDEFLDYYWTASYLTPGQPTPLRQVNVNSTWKPLLIYSKGRYNGKIFGDVFVSDGNDKSLHKWGQSESGMLSIIKGICLPGQSILDPFCGAGTTLVAGLQHNCYVTGIDIDEQNIKITKGRLAL